MIGRARACAPRSALGAAAIACALAAPVAHAGPDAAAAAARPHATAHRRAGAITIDGVLDDAGWQGVPAVGGFVQRFPDAGKPPAQATEFMIVYDDDALYVGLRMHDDHPALIRGLLTRRDGESASDWISVSIDSYHDRRTAFTFALDPAGVQRDGVTYDDAESDESWDAVWSGRAAVDADGWTAELRIPVGQLRFAGGGAVWGLQVDRVVARTGEESVWSPWPRSSTRVVSRFGELDGLADLRPGRRLELLPYAAGGVALDEAPDPQSPFARTARARGGAGLDVRYGLGSAFTLVGTINPDFGQVEADPSQVNLTGDQLHFAEKRPFFLEGTDIFQFSLGQGDGPAAQDSLFYSRRIGAAPHADLSGYAYADAPAATRIDGAAKLSGQTASGWALGVLEAVTAEETGRVDDGGGAGPRTITVEPLTNYAMARAKRGFGDGATTIGAAVTAVDRALDGTGLGDVLHDQAYTGGLQLEHRFGPADEWEANARAFASYVHGAPAAIAATAHLLRHLYQRPDQTYLHLAPDATSLAGGGVVAEVGRLQGAGWHYGLGLDARTPGFEANDLGFQMMADYILPWGLLEYHDDTPGEHVLAWEVNGQTWAFANWAPQVRDTGVWVASHATLASHWDLSASGGFDANQWDQQALRGGPELREDPSYSGAVAVATDPRRAVAGSASLDLTWKPADASRTVDAMLGAVVQARSNLSIAVGPALTLRTDDHQYVDQVADGGGVTRYVFGRIHEVVTSLTVRGAWTFSPTLSLQVYAEPFIATGRYVALKEAADTHARDYAARWHVFGDAHQATVGDTVMVDRDGDGAYDYAFPRPDFTALQLRSNVVVRWEWRPGSSLFVIWSHDGEGARTDGGYRFGPDAAALARQPGVDVVMAKLSYWIGL